MGKEIEAKVLISAEEFVDIICCKFSKSVSYKETKLDTYYSKYDSTAEAKEAGEPLVRIRTDHNGSFLTLKKKTITEGVEHNEENETLVDDIDVVKLLLASDGYKEYFTKSKTSYYMGKLADMLLVDNRVNIEVEVISNGHDKKLYAIEVEALSEDDSVTDEVLAKDVNLAFEFFGKTPNDYETRSWMELLS